ncbi:MAG: hypothetical protein HQM06_09585 [Magnetococcales bacterium]|nr:hypothetical protein [Magnetococcales bacterium]
MAAVEPASTAPALPSRPPMPGSPFAWGLRQRLAVALGLIVMLWLVVDWALDGVLLG